MNHFEEVRLQLFCEESNKIEGVTTQEEHQDHYRRIQVLLSSERLTIQQLSEFNTAGVLRDSADLNVQVGGHIAPSGGMSLVYELENILEKVDNENDAYRLHWEFEHLHPFMDGNGRTGRAVWLWQMMNQKNYTLGNLFLQEHYYQSLRQADGHL